MTGESERRRIMHIHAIRAMLLGSEDGLTSKEMATVLKTSSSVINAILQDTYGFYIDRWDTTQPGCPAVWMCVSVPENCPKPSK